MRFTLVILSALVCFSVRAETLSNDKDSDEAIVQAAEKLMSEDKADTKADAKAETKPDANTATAGATAATAPTAAADATAKAEQKESDIPVFTKSDKLQKSETSLIWRLIASLVIVAAVGGAMIFAGRRWSWKKNKGGDKARIEILHQYHLGPRKSLALVRVAGEAVLIGCTDHSINMIKPVTLIDDELEGVLGKDFNGFLEDDFSVEDVRSAITRPRA